MLSYPGEQKNTNQMIATYRSYLKDFRSDISTANLQKDLAPFVADLKLYVNKSPNTLPDSYETMIPQLVNQLHGFIERARELPNGKEIVTTLSQTQSILNSINTTIGRALYDDREIPLESVCHGLNAAYANMRQIL